MSDQEEQQEDHLSEDTAIYQIVNDLVAKEFSDLASANIGVLVKEQIKQTISKNPCKIYLAKASDRFFHGKDFIMELERNIIRVLDPVQLENLIFRTLSRAFLNDKGEFKIQPPDYQIFKKELSRYGENGLFDIIELIKTVNENAKRSNKDVVPEQKEDFDQFEE